MYKILIVDDEKIERNGIRFLLKKLNLEFEIAEAVNGVDALEKLEKEDFDILLTDVKMPFMDGIELIDHVVKERKKLRTVIFSGCNESTAFCLPIYSYSVPPKSFVILYFPSENAPAPPNPHMIEQCLQLIQFLILSPSIGHFLFFKVYPSSNTAILYSCFFFISSYAAKIPPGPAPIIITSYFIHNFTFHLSDKLIPEFVF